MNLAPPLSAFFWLISLVHLRFAYRTLVRDAIPGNAGRLVWMWAGQCALCGVIFIVCLPQSPALAAALALGFSTCFLHPALAVSFLVANLTIRPWELLPELAVLALLPRLIASIAVASFLLFSLSGSQQLRVVWHPAFNYLAALVIWLSMSALGSPEPWAALDYVCSQFFPVGVLTLLAFNVAGNQDESLLLRSVLCISAAGVVVCALLITGGQLDIADEPSRLNGSGLWGNANDLGALIVAALPFALLGGARARKAFGVPMLRWLILIVFFVALWWTQSRGAFLSIGAGGAGYLLFCRQRRSSGFLRNCALSLLMIGLPVVLAATLYRTDVDTGTSSAARWNFVIAAVRMAAANPVLGVGPEQYEKLYEQYTPSFDEWGERAAHSSWMLMLAEGGPAALLFFSAFFYFGLRSAWKCRRDVPEYFLVLLCYGMAMSFLSHSYLFLPYLVVTLVLIRERVESRAKAGEAHANALVPAFYLERRVLS